MYARVIITDKAVPHACVPYYIVYPVQWIHRNTRDIFSTSQICVIDFGEAFESANPPRGGVGTPLPYASPELALEQYCFPASDVYALACTIYQIRTGSRLFPLVEESIDFYLDTMVDERGPLPAWWWKDWVDEWKKAHLEIEGTPAPAPETLECEEVRRRRYIKESMSGRVSHFLEVPDSISSGAWHEALPDDEKEFFEDLLYEMTWHDPPMRLSVEDVLRHPWFSYKPKAIEENKQGNSAGIEQVESPGPDIDEPALSCASEQEKAEKPQFVEKLEPVSDTSGSTTPDAQVRDQVKTEWFETREHQPESAAKPELGDTERSEQETGEAEGERSRAHSRVYTVLDFLRRASRAVRTVFR